MSQWEHERQPGYLSAMKELHRRVAEDIREKRGEIKKPRTLFAYYDSKIVQIVKTVFRLARKEAA